MIAADTQRRFAALARLYGDAGARRIRAAHVAVVGIGGVGSWAVEALARSGVGQLTLIDLDHVADTPDPSSTHDIHAENDTLSRLMSLVHQLKPPDRQVMLLYLDGLDAKETGEITGLSPGAVATRIHRIKAILAKRFSAPEGAGTS